MYDELNLSTLTDTADRLGITLPRPVADTLAGLAVITADQPADEDPIAALLDQLDNAKALPKALDAAVDHLARRDARRELLRELRPVAVARAWRTVVDHREDVATAFGTVMQPCLDVLAEHAPTLPDWLTDAHVADLSPAQFTAHRAAADVMPTLTVAWQALRPLYGNLDRLGPAFTPRVSEHLAYVDPGQPENDRQAWPLINALDGRGMGGGEYATRQHVALFWPSAVAAAGGTFAFATPAERNARGDSLAAGARVKADPTLTHSGI